MSRRPWDRGSASSFQVRGVHRSRLGELTTHRPCPDGSGSGKKRDAGTPHGRPQVPLGDVRLGRVAAVREAPSARGGPSDRFGHHRDPSPDPSADAAATDGPEGKDPTAGVIPTGRPRRAVGSAAHQLRHNPNPSASIHGGRCSTPSSAPCWGVPHSLPRPTGHHPVPTTATAPPRPERPTGRGPSVCRSRCRQGYPVGHILVHDEYVGARLSPTAPRTGPRTSARSETRQPPWRRRRTGGPSSLPRPPPENGPPLPGGDPRWRRPTLTGDGWSARAQMVRPTEVVGRSGQLDRATRRASGPEPG